MQQAIDALEFSDTKTRGASSQCLTGYRPLLSAIAIRSCVQDVRRATTPRRWPGTHRCPGGSVPMAVLIRGLPPTGPAAPATWTAAPASAAGGPAARRAASSTSGTLRRRGPRHDGTAVGKHTPTPVGGPFDRPTRAPDRSPARRLRLHPLW
jgi:hypothetical protein